LRWPQENTTIFSALKNGLIIEVAIVFALSLVEFDADPIPLGLAFDFAEKLDVSLLTLVLERNKLHAITNRKFGNL